MWDSWWAYVFPIVIMGEMFASSIILAIAGKWGTALYWFFGAAISFSATFLIPKLG